MKNRIREILTTYWGHSSFRPLQEDIIGSVLADHAGGWALPREPTIAVDVDYVLAAAGLLAGEYPSAALGLVASRLPMVKPLLR